MIYDNDDRLLTDLAEKVEEIVADLKATRRKFDSIVVRGVSGPLVGPPVALALGKHLLVVRKVDEDAHDSTPVLNGKCGAKRALFLDDLRASGNTENACYHALKNFHHTDIVHCYFYRGLASDGFKVPLKGKSAYR